ncbi:DNA helicase [Tanacetum coccineum]
MNILPGHTTRYISTDEAMPHGHDGGEVEMLYPPEYLNALNFPGLPPHELQLKIGTPIMLLRNINVVGGLCNGTRMIIRQLLPKVTPIQANMDLNDAEYFDQLLQLQKAYRFSGFNCEPTDPWERTLPTRVSLIFGRFLHAQEIANADFPEHYFSFIAYNELSERLNARNPILTAVIPLVWHEMAQQFDVREYEAMEKPVVIAVSSCYINRYIGLQLSGTLATHYYLNPNIPETYQIKQIELDSQQRRPSTQSAAKDVGTMRSAHDQANTLTTDINEVLAGLVDKDPYTLPPSLKQLEGTTHTFQFHFDVVVSTRRPVFILDKVFPNTILALSPPVVTETPDPYTATETEPITTPIESLAVETSNLQTAAENPQTQTAIQTPTDNIPTTSTNEQSTKKEQPDNKSTKTSVRKALFKHEPEATPSQTTKKAKQDP